ncbi:MAG: hypothetical protein AAFV29_25685, partial [Myxococcota bacterium]
RVAVFDTGENKDGHVVYQAGLPIAPGVLASVETDDPIGVVAKPIIEGAIGNPHALDDVNITDSADDVFEVVIRPWRLL